MAKQLRIGFIQARNEFDVHWSKPLSFGYLKAYLDKYLKGAVDMHFIDSSEIGSNYDIIAISSSSQDFLIAKEIASTVKNISREIITILGGHHITFFPQTLSQEFDIGALGEGEATFLEIIDYFNAHGPVFNNNEFKKINGIVFRDNDSFVKTPKRDLIYPLDSIPFPYRLEKSDPYLFSSRGCPYKCAFCGSSAFWCKTRFFTAEYIVKEIEHIIEQFPDIKNISIWDDLFIANKDRFKKFIGLIEDRGLNNKVTYSLSVRANLVDDELGDDLKKLNIKTTSFGAESGSDRVLNVLRKGTTVEVNQRAIDTLYKHGIRITCSFIVGVPSETEDEVRSTYEFIIRNTQNGKLSAGGAVNILMPLPGTEMWRYAVKSDIIDTNNFDWRRLSVFSSYKHSQAKSFNDWVKRRRDNDSIYLAEDSLPQERLYKIMYEYEKQIWNLRKPPLGQRLKKRGKRLIARLSKNQR